MGSGVQIPSPFTEKHFFRILCFLFESNDKKKKKGI